MAGTAQNLHMELMAGTPMLHNTGVGGNGIGVTTRPAAAPPAATAAGQQQVTGRESAGYSALTAAENCFGLAVTIQEFKKN